MSRVLGYFAHGNYGTKLVLPDPDSHPKKQLLAALGIKSARRMFIDKADGSTRHIGYVAGGEWFTIYNVTEWSQRVDAEPDDEVEEEENT